jgi:hypothetical protein
MKLAFSWFHQTNIPIIQTPMQLFILFGTEIHPETDE